MNNQTIELNGLKIYLKDNIVICVRDLFNGQFVKTAEGVKAISQAQQIKKEITSLKVWHVLNVASVYAFIGALFGLFLAFTLSPLGQDTNIYARSILQILLIILYLGITCTLHRDMINDLKHNIKVLRQIATRTI